VVVEQPGLTFDLAKTLIESVCKTVLRERSIDFSEKDDLPHLFKQVTQCLPFLPTTASGESEVRQSLAQTLGGLRAATQGICELRNRCGFASHGSGEPRPAMEATQARLAAAAADVIVGFLCSVHRQDRTLPPSQSILYETNPRFNDYVDDACGAIRIFEAEFQPSEVLFEMEPETYHVYLAEFMTDVDGVDNGETALDSTEVVP
jgi:hypothetical protein